MEKYLLMRSRPRRPAPTRRRCRRVAAAALGELAGSAKEGLLAPSMGVGLGVLAEQMLEEVVGPRGKHDPDRSAVRHPHRGRRRSSTTNGTSPAADYLTEIEA